MNKDKVIESIFNSRKNVRDFVGRWREKYITEENTFDKFISIYIGHNALINNYFDFKCRLENGGSHKPDRYKMIDFVLLIFQEEEMESIILDTKMQSLINSIIDIIKEGQYIYNFDRISAGYRNNDDYYKNQIDKLNIKTSDLDDSKYLKGLQSPNPRKVFESILKIIYKVRCNLFHGDKEYTMDGKQERNIKIALSCLEIIHEKVNDKWNIYIDKLIEKIEN